MKLWIENEKLLFADKGAHSALSNWKLTYFMLLQSYFFIRYSKYVFIHRLEKQLSQLELEHGIVVRWDKSDPQYTCARLEYLREKRQQVQSLMWATVSRRQYLL